MHIQHIYDSNKSTICKIGKFNSKFLTHREEALAQISKMLMSLLTAAWDPFFESTILSFETFFASLYYANPLKQNYK